MCGFVGLVDSRKTYKKEEVIKKMADRIKHRGPDDEGYYTDDNIALGFRRLSIIDLDNGFQPIYNEDKSMVITYNGEIYNYKELRSTLEKCGHTFKTNTDTEVILHGYEEYKCELFNKLRGMFSFVIYNIKDKELIAVRDYFGIKPLYYYKEDDLLLVGSEIKSFLEHPNFKKQVNDKALKMYLIFQYSVFEETFFKNVYKLKPGFYFKYKDGELNIKKYFNIEYKRTDKSYEEYKELLKHELEESIKYHQITSDVEVGSYLSGGVDSSYVASVAKPDKTFSVGFKEKSDNKLTFDETVYAKELSKKLGIKNYSDYITKKQFFATLPTILYHTDEPHANLSTVPLYFLSSLASKKVKVVLSGEGADEMFGGYNEYYEPTILKFYASFPLGFRKFIGKIVKPLPHFPGQNTLIMYSKPFYERYIGHAFVMNEEEANEILCDKLKDNMMISEITKPYYDKMKKEDDISKKLYLDMHMWLAQDILLKADKMTMANSLELRVPFLDIAVWNLARQIPTKYMMKDKQTKYIFRDIALNKIPSDWANRRKLGFPVPFSKWIREKEYYKKVKDIFNMDYVDKYFDKQVINNLLEEHYSNKKNNGRKIYNIYIFLLWYKRYFIDEDKNN
ncbi:MAG: asparagine synthase (glutamine-hydrolyzing) [bacterium]|nr:asparagine synthase (glutamine-hydrolyzing) [bacterium]